MRAACHGKGSGASGAGPGQRAQTGGTNPAGSGVVPIAGGEALGTAPAMTEPTPAPPDHNTRPILSLEDLQARYDIGKTKATELARSDGFPNTVVPGMHRYRLADHGLTLYAPTPRTRSTDSTAPTRSPRSARSRSAASRPMRSKAAQD